jgi:ribosomal protein S18 acetylase RimI-like enzyme
MVQNHFIRDAEKKDAPFVAPLLVQAMDQLACFFTSNTGKAEEIKLFETFFQQIGNQYSFENTIVYEIGDKVVGFSNGYDGGKLTKLREPFFNYIQSKYNVQFPFTDDETEPGEYYIDCISVLPAEQGKGIGSQLLNEMIEKGRKLGFKKIGLIVDSDNQNAKRLYTKMGFKKVKNRSFMSGNYEHLQFEIE